MVSSRGGVSGNTPEGLTRPSQLKRRCRCTEESSSHAYKKSRYPSTMMHDPQVQLAENLETTVPSHFNLHNINQISHA
eukprot:204565-Hanusia_phi.AAC.1